MDELLRDLRKRVQWVMQQASAYLSEVPSSTLQLTGVLGLAAIVYTIYQLRGTGRKPGENDGAGTSGTQGRTSAATSARGGTQAKPSGPGPEAGNRLASSVGSQLAGVRSVTISAPGVLLEEWTPAALTDGATLRPDAAAVVKEIGRIAAVYIIAHVADDLGEATVRGALEAGGVTGNGAGQVPPHRLITCSTLEGKVSIVRQLEPELHIDGHPQTVEDLKRFMPQLLHIRQAGTPAAAPGSPNVGSSTSLAQVLGGV